MEKTNIFSLEDENKNKVLENISKLNFLSKIRKNEKINVKDLFVRDNDSIPQRFIRTIKNWTDYFSSLNNVESKESTLKFINETITSSLNLIFFYKTNENDENTIKFRNDMANLIIKNLNLSIMGINNLIDTYQNDRKFISDAQAVMQTLHIKIDSMIDDGYIENNCIHSLKKNC